MPNEISRAFSYSALNICYRSWSSRFVCIGSRQSRGPLLTYIANNFPRGGKESWEYIYLILSIFITQLSRYDSLAFLFFYSNILDILIFCLSFSLLFKYRCVYNLCDVSSKKSQALWLARCINISRIASGYRSIRQWPTRWERTERYDWPVVSRLTLLRESKG